MGIAVGDFDGDGDSDMFLTHWIGQGYGPKVFLEANGKRQMREYGAGGSYLSQSAPEAWFGLGPLERVEKVEVQWKPR